MNIKEMTFPELKFSLTTDEVRSDPQLKADIEEEIARRKKEYDQINALKKKNLIIRRRCYFVIIAFIILCLAYCEYKVYKCTDCVETMTRYAVVRISNISKAEAEKFNAVFQSDEFHRDVVKKFPQLKNHIHDKIVYKSKHHTDVISHETYVELKIGLKRNSEQGEDSNQHEILKLYSDKVLKYFGVSLE